MAKELPFFKFEPNQWENGNIQMCSLEAQGIFMNVCSMYWQRLGDLPYKLAVQKICKGNATAFDSLIEDDVIKVIDGMICIDFLNEQLLEFGNVSKVNSENARLGWEKRRKEATVMRPHSEPNAIRGDKRRGEEIREEKKLLSTSVDDVPKNEFEKSILEIIREIKSEYLEVEIRPYKITNKRTKLIANRKKEFVKLWPGRNFEKACQFAFRYKAKEWFGTETFRFFEPETLLSEKFTSYVEKAEQDKGEPYVPKPKGEDKPVYRIPQ